MIVGGQFDKNGRPVRIVDPLQCGVTGANGALRYGCRRLGLAQAIASGDPGSRLASPITDGGLDTGLSFPLTGGWASTDFAGAYPYLTFPFLDLWGNPYKGTNLVAWPRLFVLVRGTPPSNSDEVAINVSLLNEADPTTGTVDGRGCSITWTGSQTLGRSTSIVNGSIANGSTNGTGLIVLDAVIARIGSGTNSISSIAGWSDVFATSLFDVVGGANSTFPVSGPLYINVCAGRTSAGAAGAITPTFDVFYAPPIFVENWPS